MGVSYPGQMVSLSLLVWRSDGNTIEQFLATPPNPAPPGFAVYPQRQDARHCRVDVVWLIPEKIKNSPPSKTLAGNPAARAHALEPGLVAVTFEIVVDGVKTRVPLRMRLMAGAPVVRRLEQLVRPHVRAFAAAGAALAVLMGASWAVNQNNRTGSALATFGVRAGSGKAAPRVAVSPVPTPQAPPRPSRRITSVQKWRDIAIWRVQNSHTPMDDHDEVVVDIDRRLVQQGDSLVASSTRRAELHAALVFQDVNFGPERDRFWVQAGSEEHVKIQTVMEPSAPAFTSSDQERRQNLEQIVAFLLSESQRLRQPHGTRPVDTLLRYRQAFQTQIPFRGDFLQWNLRLVEGFMRHDDARATPEDLEELAWQAQHTYQQILPQALPPRAVKRIVRVSRPLQGALVLVSAKEITNGGEVLRAVGQEDTGLFYALQLSRPISVGGKPFQRLLSREPFRSSSQMLPRYIVRPDGVSRLALGSLPDASASGPALLIPGARVDVTLIDNAEIEPADASPPQG